MSALFVVGWFLAGYIAAGHFYGYMCGRFPQLDNRAPFWAWVLCGYGSLVVMLCMPWVRQADRVYPWQSTRWRR